MVFAREVHKDQRRMYTSNPYFDHLAEVVGIAMSVGWHHPQVHPDVFMAVGWLHDSLEDQGVDVGVIEARFGPEVACGVMWLTDSEKGTRAQRKAASRERLSGAPAWVQTIKVADIISNTGSIVLHDPDFARGYLEEKNRQLEVLGKSHPQLLEFARQQVGFQQGRI